MGFTRDGDLWKQKFMQLDTLVYFYLTFRVINFRSYLNSW